MAVIHMLYSIRFSCNPKWISIRSPNWRWMRARSVQSQCRSFAHPTLYDRREQGRVLTSPASRRSASPGPDAEELFLSELLAFGFRLSACM